MSDKEDSNGAGSAAEGSDGEEEAYEVEKILNHKKSRGLILYEVKWKGYSEEESTWEPEENLAEGSQEMLDEYKALHVKEGKKKEKPSKTSPNKKARGASSVKEDPGSDQDTSTVIKDDDDDDFQPEKKKRSRDSSKSAKRKSAAVVDSDSESESEGKKKVDNSILPPSDECTEVASVCRPKKTPAEVPGDTLYFLTSFTKGRKLLIPSSDVQKYYPSQLSAFLLKRVQFREGAGEMANGNGNHDHQNDMDED